MLRWPFPPSIPALAVAGLGLVATAARAAPEDWELRMAGQMQAVLTRGMHGAEASAATAVRAGSTPATDLQATVQALLADAVTGNPSSTVPESEAERLLDKTRRSGAKAERFDLLVALELRRMRLQELPLRAERLREATTLATELGEPARQAWLEHLQGMEAELFGHFGSAIAQHQIALQRLQAPALKAWVMCSLGDALAASGRPYGQAGGQAGGQGAIEVYDAAARLIDASASPYFTCAMTGKASAQIEVGLAGDAAALSAQALQRMQAPSDAPRHPARLALLTQAQAELALGHEAEARAALQGLDPALLRAADQREFALLQAELAALAAQGDAVERWVQFSRAKLPASDETRPARELRIWSRAAAAYRVLGRDDLTLNALSQAATARRTISESTIQRALKARLGAFEEAAGNERLQRATASTEALKSEGLKAVAIAAALAAPLAVLLRRRQRQRGRIRNLNAELEQRNAQLQSLLASRTLLVSRATGEMRQPAHAISVRTELLKSASASPERRLALVAQVGTAAHTLAEQLDELMDLTRLEAGLCKPAFAALDLATVLEELTPHLRELAEARQVSLEIKAGPAAIAGDDFLVRRLVSNLVSRSLRQVAPGRSLQLTVRRMGEQVLLELHHGTASAAQPSHAEQGQARTADAGLDEADLTAPVAPLIAQLLGYEITSSNEAGQQQCTVKMPASAPPASVDTPAPGAPSLKHVAIIDDDDTLTGAVCTYLRQQGYAPLAGPDAPTLIAAARQAGVARPDVIVTDLRLGARNGLDGVDVLRQVPGWDTVPLLLVTGDASEAVRQRAEALGVSVAYKPVAPAKLVKLLQSLVAASPPRSMPLQLRD